MKKITNSKPQLLVYTDLDGTLLNHHDYSYVDALPAINKLNMLRVPVIPVTSKTLAEVFSLIKKLNLVHPIIAENGSIIAFPDAYFPQKNECKRAGDYSIQQVSVPYKDIITSLQKVRIETDYRFKGFFDMTIEEVAHYTGLSLTDAENAKSRSGCEPLLWLDDESKIPEFNNILHREALKLEKGGRFWHVMGNTSKGEAINIVNELYRKNLYENITTIGLGDSPNDISMLEEVDIPVIVKSINNDNMQLNTSVMCSTTKYPGPKGWSQFVLEYLSISNGNDYDSTSEN